MSSAFYYRVLILSFTVLAIIANMGISVAQELDPVLAKEKFQEGLAKIRKQEYQAALEAFEASYCYKPKAIVTFNIAMCQKALYKYAEALGSFKKYLKEAGESPKPDRRDLTRAAILEIEQLVGKVRVLGAPDGTKIYFDDVFIGTTPLEKLITVNPGRYVARVVPKEGEPFETIVAVIAGAEVTLNANLKVIAKPDRPKGQGPSLPEEEEMSFSYVGKISALSIGVVSGMLGIVFTVVGQNTYNKGQLLVSLDTATNEHVVHPSNLDDYNTLREKLPKYQTGMIVSYSISAVFLGAGAILSVIDAKKGKSSSAKLRLSPAGVVGEF